MQSAKDSFYVGLRNRIAAINPGRTVDVRGVSRPGIVVSENELATAIFATETFFLTWVAMSVDPADVLVRMQCEISYATDGTSGNGGMDRGRMLSEMDAELLKALLSQPQNAPKTAFTTAGTTAMLTNVFWGDPAFGKSTVSGERLSRTATVEVFAYQEAGEL